MARRCDDLQERHDSLKCEGAEELECAVLLGTVEKHRMAASAGEGQGRVRVRATAEEGGEGRKKNFQVGK